MHHSTARYKFLDNFPRFSRNWTRRKGPIRLDALPDDILILIFSASTLDTVFALRLTCTTFSSLFTTYAQHIVIPVARCTFPHNVLLLRNPQPTFSWLKALIPQYLAATLVEYQFFSPERRGIPSEDPFGDELRSRVAGGWNVLSHLSSIARSVHALDASAILPLSSLDLKSLSPQRYRAEVARRREKMVLERRLAYIAAMPVEQAQDYVIMFTLLSFVFKILPWTLTELKLRLPPWMFDFGNGIDAARLVRRGESWMTWFILHEGPQLFWEQWWRLPWLDCDRRDYVRERALEAFFQRDVKEKELARYPETMWRDADEEWHGELRRMAWGVQRAVQEKSGGNHHYGHVRYFHDYENGGRSRQIAQSRLDVPFAVNFRAWESTTGGAREPQTNLQG